MSRQVHTTQTVENTRTQRCFWAPGERVAGSRHQAAEADYGLWTAGAQAEGNVDAQFNF